MMLEYDVKRQHDDFPKDMKNFRIVSRPPYSYR